MPKSYENLLELSTLALHLAEAHGPGVDAAGADDAADPGWRPRYRKRRRREMCECPTPAGSLTSFCKPC